jgi:tRNA-dihydrouridine synthase B
VRAARYLRKFHPWYVERLGAPKSVQDALQRAETLAEQREVLLLCSAASAPL